MHRTQATSRGPSGNRRNLHVSADITLNHRVETFSCAQIDAKGRARILRELRAMRGTLTAKFQGDYLTCIFAHQKRQSFNKLTRRISRLLHKVRQTNFISIAPTFA